MLLLLLLLILLLHCCRYCCCCHCCCFCCFCFAAAAHAAGAAVAASLLLLLLLLPVAAAAAAAAAAALPRVLVLLLLLLLLLLPLLLLLRLLPPPTTHNYNIVLSCSRLAPPQGASPCAPLRQTCIADQTCIVDISVLAMSSWIMDIRLKPAACSDISPFSQPAMAQEMEVAVEVVAVGSVEMLCRPCVDCGKNTGSFCKRCCASHRIPSEEWAFGQMTPLCSDCNARHSTCHYCRRVAWARPFAWGPWGVQEQAGAGSHFHWGGPVGWVP